MHLHLLRQRKELVPAVLLQILPQGQVLPVELHLLVSSQSLPRCWVTERSQAKLLVLQLLGDGLLLPWS